MNMMISYQELVRTFLSSNFRKAKKKKGNFPREREVTFLIISGNWR